MKGRGLLFLGLSIFSNMAGLCSVLSHRPSVLIESQSQQPWRKARISSNKSLGMSSAWSKIPELVGEGPGVWTLAVFQVFAPSTILRSLFETLMAKAWPWRPFNAPLGWTQGDISNVIPNFLPAPPPLGGSSEFLKQGLCDS